MSEPPARPAPDRPTLEGLQPVETRAIVLAAGAGRRFGGAKMCALWRGEPLVRAALRSALRAPVGGVHLVVGCEAEEVVDALGPLRGAVQVVRAERWAEGLSASLRAGVDSLPPETRAALVFLGDMPTIPDGLAARLLGEVKRGARAAYPTLEDRPGHPVALARTGFDLVHKARGDRGLGPVLKGERGVVRVPIDHRGCRHDIDRSRDVLDGAEFARCALHDECQDGSPRLR